MKNKYKNYYDMEAAELIIEDKLRGYMKTLPEETADVFLNIGHNGGPNLPANYLKALVVALLDVRIKSE